MPAPRGRALAPARVEVTETAYLSHRSPGRVRLRFPDRRGDVRFFAELTERLGAFEAVLRVEGNPRTGSVLLLHAGDPGPVLETARREKLFRVFSREPLEPSLAPRLREELQSASEGLTRLTGGQIDLGTAAFLFLLAGGIVQMMRGQILGPATTMLWYASTLLAAGAVPTGRGSDAPQDETEPAP